MDHVIIYTDGAARGNPDGPGGYGAVLLFTDAKGQEHRREIARGYVRTTNNRMELLAAIRALELLRHPCRVDLYSDSKYLIDAFNQNWIGNWQKKNWIKSDGKPVKNPDLWRALLNAAEPHEIIWHWIKGHDGHPLNERCDALATAAADSRDLIEDVPLDKG